MMVEKEAWSDDETSIINANQYAFTFPLRNLRPEDKDAVKELCAQSFPISYPECWFDEVVSGSLNSLGLFDDGNLAAMIVTETKKLHQCNSEDREILDDASSSVVYILSLAVSSNYRRMGLATRLLNKVIDSVVYRAPFPRAVFLHVLSTNFQAINFYRANGFEWHNSLINYYRIGDGYGDGCTYVRYAHGQQAPLGFIDFVRSVGTAICLPLRAICNSLAYSGDIGIIHGDGTDISRHTFRKNLTLQIGGIDNKKNFDVVKVQLATST